jgi:hypothetical protein
VSRSSDLFSDSHICVKRSNSLPYQLGLYPWAAATSSIYWLICRRKLIHSARGSGVIQKLGWRLLSSTGWSKGKCLLLKKMHFSPQIGLLIPNTLSTVHDLYTHQPIGVTYP